MDLAGKKVDAQAHTAVVHNRFQVPGPRKRTRFCKKVAIGILFLAFLACALEAFWDVHTSAGFKTSVSENYYIQTFFVRSPLRLLSEFANFMPHSSVEHWGREYGYKDFLCQGNRRVVEISRRAHRAAAVLPDESHYAYLSPRSPRVLMVIRVRDGQRLLVDTVLSEEEVAKGKTILYWKDPIRIEILEYVVENSAVLPPRLLKEITLQGSSR